MTMIISITEQRTIAASRNAVMNRTPWLTTGGTGFVTLNGHDPKHRLDVLDVDALDGITVKLFWTGATSIERWSWLILDHGPIQLHQT